MEELKLIKKIYTDFYNYNKPQIGVNDPTHCLACEETYKQYQAFEDRDELHAKDFRICYMSIDCLTKDALKYMMPRLLELVIKNEELKVEDNYLELFIPQLIRGLLPNEEDQLRFKDYDTDQINCISHFLEMMDKRSSKNINGDWTYENEDWICIENDALGINQDVKKALVFWRNKLT